MPSLSIHTSASVSVDKAEALLKRLSLELQSALSKPERYVATSLSQTVAMTFGGTTDPACLVEVSNIGKLSPDQTSAVSRAVCEAIASELSVSKERIYVRFFEMERHLWGHAAGTFAG